MFITLEGIDGCGKSTQAAILNEKIAASTGKNVFWTREPGGWAQGGLIRSLLLEEDLYHPLSELFLFVIDRCEHEALHLTGVILSKYDNTAKGGIILAIAHHLGLPIRYVGLGEGVDDLRRFEPKLFVSALLERNSDEN